MDEAEATATGRRTPWGCFVSFAALSIFIAYWVGRAHQELISSVSRQDEQIARISQFLGQNSDRYASLSFNRGPSDKFRVQGQVRTQEDLDVLKAELIRLFGEERAYFVLAVEVVDEAEQAGPTAVPETGDSTP